MTRAHNPRAPVSHAGKAVLEVVLSAPIPLRIVEVVERLAPKYPDVRQAIRELAASSEITITLDMRLISGSVRR